MKTPSPWIAIVFSLSLILTGCGQSNNDNYTAAELAYEDGDYEKAIELFTLAAQDSDNPAIYGNRANCYSYLGDLEAALKDDDTAIQKSLELTNDSDDPNLAYCYYNRGFAYERAKQFEQAIQDYEKTISLNDEYPDVKNNLAWILATCPHEKVRDPRRAVTIAEAEGEKTDWKDETVLDTLAAAHASAGDFSKAIERQEQAIAITEDAEIRKVFRERLALYRSNKSFIMPTDNGGG